jgi:integrase/recombinase XerD
MDDWGFEQLEPWLRVRQTMPVGPLFCVISGRTCGRAWPPSAARADLKRRAARAGVRRRFVPHQLRHAHALELAHEGVPLIQRQLGHRNLGVTSIYLQGIDPQRDHRHRPRPPTADDPASAGLVLPLGG